MKRLLWTALVVMLGASVLTGAAVAGEISLNVLGQPIATGLIQKNKEQPKFAFTSQDAATRSMEKERHPKQAGAPALEAAGIPKPERKFKTAVPMRHKKEPVPKTPALEQLDLVGKLARNLDRIHGR